MVGLNCKGRFITTQIQKFNVETVFNIKDKKKKNVVFVLRKKLIKAAEVIALIAVIAWMENARNAKNVISTELVWTRKPTPWSVGLGALIMKELVLAGYVFLLLMIWLWSTNLICKPLVAIFTLKRDWEIFISPARRRISPMPLI